MAQININRQPIIIPEKGSPCDLWRTYFQQLKREVGRVNAQSIWLITWNEYGSSSCANNPDFSTWLQKNDLDVTTASSRAIAGINTIGDNVLGLGKNVTKVMAVGVPLVMGSVTLMVLLFLFRMSKKAKVSDLALLTPMGRAAATLKSIGT